MAPPRRLPAATALAAALLAATASHRAAGMDLSMGAIMDDIFGHAQTQFPGAGKPCGVSGILDKGTDKYLEPASVKDLQCQKRMTTNCSVTYSSLKCPSDCAYLVPNHNIPCLFECVSKGQCSSKNPNRAYANPNTHQCDTCNIAGCKVCDADCPNGSTMHCLQRKCAECHAGFTIADGGKTCKFHLDAAANWPTVLMVLGILLGCLVLLAVVWFIIHGPHPHWEANMVAILRARRHRRLTKVYAWDLANPRQMRSRFGLAENMHKKNVIGVGVALFYNNILFISIIALIFFVATYMVFERSDLSKALGKFEDPAAALQKSMVSPAQYKPAIIISPLAICGKMTGTQTQVELDNFARTNFIVLGILYVATFIISLIFGFLQQRAAVKFDEANSTMSDYALQLRGLPEDATNEPELQKWLQEEFRKVIPDKWGRPDEVIHRMPPEEDEVKPRPPSQVEVFGVSVCYRYMDKWAQVDDVLWKEIEQMEADMSKKAGYDMWDLTEKNTTAATRDMTFQQVQDENRKVVAEWFEEGENKLKGTGEAFVVFNYIPDKGIVEQYAEAHPDFLRHPSAPDKPITVLFVASEPVSIAWWFVGIPRGELAKRTMRNFFWILFVIGLVQLLIVFPYARFILLPYAMTGSAAGGMKMTIAGIVLGNVNGFLFITNFMTALKLGYPRKDMMDVFVLVTNTLLVFINTFFNIVITVVMVSSQNDALSHVAKEIFAGKTLKALGTGNAVAKNLYNMLMPGSFFTGLIMAMIMAGWVPFLWNTFLMKMIYIWKCFPDCLLKVLKVFLPWAPEGLDYYPFRSAEKAFEPWEVPVCGNYADQIVTPMICFVLLFFASPYTHKTFLGMLMWSGFEYIYFRYMHLRYHKTCMYTTKRLDCWNNIMWGMPLSVIACAWAFWGYRAGILGKGFTVPQFALCIVGIFAASCLLWYLAYRFLVDPFRIREGNDENVNRTVEELSTITCYNWFNTNAPYVLKCKYYFQDANSKNIEERRKGHPLACGMDPDQVRMFEVGRQGLFAKPERHKLVYRLENDYLEFETWFEMMLHVMDRICRACRCGWMKRQPTQVNFDRKDGGAAESEMGLLASDARNG